MRILSASPAGPAAALGAVLVLSFAPGCGGQPGAEGPDDGALQRAIAASRTGAEVTFDGTVVDQPYESHGHERFHVRAGSGDVLEVDHNVTLAQRVPARTGDRLLVHGRLYVDPGATGVHCTHAHTSSGCPEPGWIRLAGTTYQ